MKVGEFMGINQVMVGCPWHIEKMVREEGDPRRHRSRCIYYSKESSHCSKIVSKCGGAAHCNYYEEKRVVEPVISDKKAFHGIKMIVMSDIEVSDKFILPSKEKIDAVIRYYKEHEKLDKPVSVSCHGKKYKLEDKYLRYYVAKQLGLKEIPARISTEKENRVEDKMRVVGAKVKHIKYGKGVVTRVMDNSVIIAFESGKETTFNIEICVKNKLITLD